VTYPLEYTDFVHEYVRYIGLIVLNLLYVTFNSSNRWWSYSQVPRWSNGIKLACVRRARHTMVYILCSSH